MTQAKDAAMLTAREWIENLFDGSNTDSQYLSNGMPRNIGETIRAALQAPVGIDVEAMVELVAKTKNHICNLYDDPESDIDSRRAAHLCLDALKDHLSSRGLLRASGAESQKMQDALRAFEEDDYIPVFRAKYGHSYRETIRRELGGRDG